MLSHARCSAEREEFISYRNRGSAEFISHEQREYIAIGISIMENHTKTRLEVLIKFRFIELLAAF